MCDQRGCTCLLRFFGSKSFMRGVSASSITASSAEIPCHDVSVIGILWLLIRIFTTCVFHKGGYHILDYWARCQALLWAAVEERCSPWITSWAADSHRALRKSLCGCWCSLKVKVHTRDLALLAWKPLAVGLGNCLWIFLLILNPFVLQVSSCVNLDPSYQLVVLTRGI